jgi:hypothetical protein
MSLLQRLGQGAPPWEDDYNAYAEYADQDMAQQRMQWEQQQQW